MVRSRKSGNAELRQYKIVIMLKSINEKGKFMKHFLTFAMVFLTIVLAGCGGAKAPDYSGPAAVIPVPASMDIGTGSFAITKGASIAVEIDSEKARTVGAILAGKLEGMGVAVETGESNPAVVLTAEGADSSLGDEGYILKITDSGAVVRSSGEAGLFYGVQTLLQLGETVTEGGKTWFVLPQATVRDMPRFAWRGLMLDCSRTFWPKDVILRYIDLLAMHKMNVFHMHLTDDQGWRVEIKAYPKLTGIGAKFDARYGDQPDGFYSQDDIREIVAYAADRNVTVVPEIDIPGHMTAAVVAYPELACFKPDNLWVYPNTERPEHIANLTEDILCAGDPKTYEFLDAVMTEIIDLFPSKYIHIGGDEAPKARWEKCPKCQAMIKKQGLHNEHELQSYMTGYLADFLEKRGRKLIGWDEIIEGGLKDNAAVMYWRGWITDAPMHTLEKGNELVMSPTGHCYFDYTYDNISTEHAYGFDPLPEGAGAEADKLLLGIQANMWTHLARDVAALDRQVFPRLLSIAEVAWSPESTRDLDSFMTRLKSHYTLLDELGVSYFVPKPAGFPGTVLSSGTVEIPMINLVENGTVRYTIDSTEPTPDSPVYSGPVVIEGDGILKARTFLANGNASETKTALVQTADFASVDAAGKKQGLAYRYCEGRFETVEDIRNAKTKKAGNIGGFEVPSGSGPGVYGIHYSGYIEIPADGRYVFSVVSDDGSRLYIGDTLAVDNDGLHPAIERQGWADLKKGLYPVTLLYSEAGGGGSIDVSWEGPGFERQAIPAEMLWRE